MSDDVIASGSTEAGVMRPSDSVSFHQKFGYGEITDIEGNELTIDFDKAGRKRDRQFRRAAVAPLGGPKVRVG